MVAPWEDDAPDDDVYRPELEYDPDIFFDETHPQHEMYKRKFPDTYRRLTGKAE